MVSKFQEVVQAINEATSGDETIEDLARVAITAMLKPTDRMLIEGHVALEAQLQQGSIHTPVVDLVWEAMIREALAPDPELMR
jgi:hypothetical protein